MATAKTSKPKSYRVRESLRAKHVSIKISHLGEVEVVVPVGFDHRQIPVILQKREDWISRTTQRIVAERQSISTPSGSPLGELPETLGLQSLPEKWQIQYELTGNSQIVLTTLAQHRLAIKGAVDHPHLCHQVLKQWLKRKAEIHLTRWLRQTSQEVSLPYHQATVRGQKTLWASCSAKTNISLNYKLLFLPPHLVRYVFIHELCHTIHLNHSRKFWGLVAEKEPNYQQFDTELNKAWIYIPEWIERSLADAG